MRFRLRRQDYGGRRSKLSPWLIIGICVAASVLLTVLVGNLLKFWLNEEALRHLIEGDGEPTLEEPIYHAPVKRVHAFSYVLGEDPEAVLLDPVTSVSLNTPAGELAYSSPVGNYYQYPTYRDPVLLDSMVELCSVSTYVSGVFYPQAFMAETGDLRYAVTMQECALIREFLQAGGSDIVLCDLPFESVSESAILSYLTAVKRSAGISPVGVAVPWELMQGEGSGAFLERLLTVCDFIALDLRDQSASLTDLTYHLQQYDMRLLLHSDQTEMIDLARQSVASFQTVTKPPQMPDTTPEEESGDGESGDQ